MTPTMKLRWAIKGKRIPTVDEVKRFMITHDVSSGEAMAILKATGRKVLQQWWEESDWGGPEDMTPPGEWRDVEVEEE